MELKCLLRRRQINSAEVCRRRHKKNNDSILLIDATHTYCAIFAV
ncbi:hypothetical protein NPIL_14171, partial [Nephila pilipes]